MKYLEREFYNAKCDFAKDIRQWLYIKDKWRRGIVEGKKQYHRRRK